MAHLCFDGVLHKRGQGQFKKKGVHPAKYEPSKRLGVEVLNPFP